MALWPEDSGPESKAFPLTPGRTRPRARTGPFADLVAHVISTHRRVIATLDDSEPVDVDPGSDLSSQWESATGAVASALGDEARASKLVGGMFGEQTFASLVGRLVCSDTLIHTWDLARATGQDETLVADAVAVAMESLAPLDDAIRRPGGFRPKIMPAPGADAQTIFLNFCGRAPQRPTGMS